MEASHAVLLDPDRWRTKRRVSLHDDGVGWSPDDMIAQSLW